MHNIIWWFSNILWLIMKTGWSLLPLTKTVWYHFKSKLLYFTLFDSIAWLIKNWFAMIFIHSFVYSFIHYPWPLILCRVTDDFNFDSYMIWWACLGWHGGAAMSHVASQQEGSGFRRVLSVLDYLWY